MRYYIGTLEENVDKVADIIELKFADRVSGGWFRRCGSDCARIGVRFSTDECTFFEILKTIEGLYITAECMNTKYPELEAFVKDIEKKKQLLKLLKKSEGVS